MNGTENTGAVWSTNGVANFVIIDLGSSMDVETVRVHQRNDGCCQDRLRDFTVSVLADSGGSPGAVVTSAVFPTQPTTNRFGEVTLRGFGATDTATVSIDVTGVNDAPVANNATYVVQEDGPPLSSQAMTGSDVDMPDPLTFSTTTSPAMGSLVDNGNGTFTFDPNGEFESLGQGQPALVSFDFEVEDSNGATDTGTITIIVQGVNDDPTPMPDGETTDEDTLLTVLAAAGLLSNDSDTDGDAIGVQSIDTTGTVGAVVADLMNLKLGAGLSGSFYDFNGPNPNSIGGNDTGNQTALLLPLPDPGEFVLKRLGLTPSATVITPRVDFGTGTNTTQGDGSVLNRGGFSSGGVPPWQGLFNNVGETADMDGDQIAATWCGKINITTTGNYTFTTRSDDATILFIDGVRVVDNNNFQGMTNRSGTVTGLTAGMHDISIGGYEGGGGAGMQASYEGPDTAATRIIIPPTVLFNDVVTPGSFVSGGLRGDYFDTNNSGTNGLTFGFNVDEFLLFDAPASIDLAIQSLFPTASDVLSPRIDFGNDTSVIPGDGSNPERGGIQGNIYGGIGVTLDQDQVGGAWSGSLFVPETADFRIWQRVDDGGTVLIDVDGNGSVHDAGDFAIGQGNADGTVTLSAGAHKIVVGAREGGGNHRMVVSWQQLTGTNPFPREVIPPQNLLLPGTGMVGDGSFTYDPNGNFESLNVGDSAMTTFTYDVVDPFGNTVTETVTMTITGVNDPPTLTTPIPDQEIFTSSPTLDLPLFPHFEDVDNDDDEQIYTVSMNTNGALIQPQVVASADGILTLDTPCTLIGTADITVTLEDTGGLTISDTFTVTVTDDVDPVISCAQDMFLNAPAGGTAMANFGGVTAWDKVDMMPVLVCSPDDSAPFPIGSTLITCTATDASGNDTVETFYVHVIEIQMVAGTRILDVVSLRDDIAPGGAGLPAAAKVLAHQNGALNNAGDILFTASLSDAGTNNRAVFLRSGGSDQALAVRNILAPGGANYGTFSDIAINDGGESTFQSATTAGNGNYRHDGTTVSDSAVAGSNAPGTTGNYRVLRKPAITTSGEVLTVSNLKTGIGGITSADDTGLWRSGSATPIAREGGLSPIALTDHSQIHPRVVASAGGDQIAFTSYLVEQSGFDGSDNTAIFAGPLGGPLAVIVREGEPSPGEPGVEIGTITGESVNGSGSVAFIGNARGTGITSANNAGLWWSDGTTLRTIAREGAIAPCLPMQDAAFARFRRISNCDDGSVFFYAYLKPAGALPTVNSTNDGSIWRWDSGSGELQLIARESQVALSTDGAQHGTLLDYDCNQVGGIVYQATMVSGIGDNTSRVRDGVWLARDASDVAPVLVLRRGDKFDIDGEEHTVSNIQLDAQSNPGGGTGGYGRVINDSGEILLNLSLNKNKSGLFKLEMP
ncbi:MAG: VCBS repeat-containing protein [Verrucomicrobiales bacterium]